jgi:plastocyanin domain-containing protein
MPRMHDCLALVAAIVFATGCKKDAPAGAAGAGEIAIAVDAVGYHPAEVHAKAGATVHLVFTRTTEDGCGTEVVIPSINVKRALPLKEPVTIELKMPAQGEVAFACGMDMMHGKVIAD